MTEIPVVVLSPCCRTPFEAVAVYYPPEADADPLAGEWRFKAPPLETCPSCQTDLRTPDYLRDMVSQLEPSTEAAERRARDADVVAFLDVRYCGRVEEDYPTSEEMDREYERLMTRGEI